VADEERQAAEGASAKQASEEASREAAEQLKAIKVADLVVQAASGLISLGSVRLARDQRDLAQARLAIDSLRALEPVVREQLSAELADELQRAVAGMQLAFAEAVNEQASPGGSVASAPEPEAAPAEAGDPNSGQ
jgi:hypothetical protein